MGHMTLLGAGKPAAGGEDYTTGLMLWWRLNENTGTSTADSSGNGHTGTLTSAGWSTGYEGSALDAAGTRQAWILDHADHRPTSAITFHCRIFTTTYGSFPFILEKAQSGVGGYGFWVNGSSNIAAYIEGEGNAFTASMPSTSAWHSLTATADGSNLIAYLNGVAGTPLARSGAIPQSSAVELVVGANSAYGTQWPGLIDDVRIYNRALTAAQVAALHASDGTT